MSQKQRSAQSDQFRAVYSNASRMNYTATDVTVMFSRLGEVMVDEVAVTLPPAIAKSLVMSLAATVDAFEARFGAINVRAEIQPERAGPGIHTASKARN